MTDNNQPEQLTTSEMYLKSLIEGVKISSIPIQVSELELLLMFIASDLKKAK